MDNIIISSQGEMISLELLDMIPSNLLAQIFPQKFEVLR